jgi:two-component system phosphate regulon sensor histidine kinase PhoR
MIYVAIPLEKNGRIACILRVSIPLVSVNRALGTVYGRILIGFVLAVAFLALLSYIIARRIKRPIDELRYGVDQFARGSLDSKIRIPDSVEFGALAESMNDMASQLSDRIETTNRQREEQEAILSSMVEGVLAVDAEERIIIINDAAAGLLQANAAESRGRSLQEAVRNADIQLLIADTISQEKPIERRIHLRSDTDVVLQAQGTIIRGDKSKISGALVILHDITRITRLENMRRDFVANVSHELKTPITAIKGFVETLSDGAISEPDEARKFLDIIVRHTNRLNATIDDLLQLSKIEQEVESRKISLAPNHLKPVLLSATELCRANADKKEINLKVVCEDNLRGRINVALLERAIVNLIDNAVKSSDKGSEIEISATDSGSEILLAVLDHGSGIEQKHHDRLFERFYRVDTARSRELGGTGLGLAIVKHIAEAHGGHASMKSRPGEGSVFTIHLPKA